MHTTERGAVTLKRTILYAVLAILVIGGVWVYKLVWGKPSNIDHFFNRVFLEYALEDPEMLTQMRILEPLGLNFHNDDLTDVSVARMEELDRKVVDDLATLRSYDRAALTPTQQMSYDILEYFLEDAVAGQRFNFYPYPVNQMSGVHLNLPDFMTQTHQIDDERGAEDYVTRLGKFDVKFDQVLDNLRQSRERGIMPPRFVVERVIGNLRGFTAPPPTDNVLYTHLVERLQALDDLDAARREQIAAAGLRAIEQVVYPAYERMLSYHEEALATASADDGVWRLPEGEAYYDHRLRSATTTTKSAHEIHQLGLAEVDRIQAEMREILETEGYDVEALGGVGPAMTSLLDEERFFYPDSDTGRQQILDDYQVIIDEVSAGLGDWFAVQPKAGVVVQRISEFKEATSAGAYYENPPRDGSRPGVFFANLRDVREVPRFGMRTLAYHEAVPGHHFQIAAQQELEGLPIFRTIPLFTAYVEGWALYAELLAWEAGFQDDPYDNLGRLQAELFRAVRLVVDTGIHAQRWSRERAIEYMVANTGMPEGEVVSEIERYIVWPGQACAYKVGMLEILELRERARAMLGERFDIRAFHDVVLRDGAVPLAILGRLVDRWIEETRG